MNRGKLAVPTIINIPELISSSSDKVKYFASIFVFNSRLEDTVHPLLNFPRLTERSLSSIFILSQDLLKALTLRKPLAQNIKNINPQLSQILAKLF